MANYVVGKIINMHGIKGEFKVYPETDAPERVNDLEYVIIKNEKFEVEGARIHKGNILLKVKGIDSINDGEKYKNLNVEIPEEFAQELKENEHFIRDIIDSKVYDENDKYLGIVTDIFSTGANDVFEITMEDNKTFLIPNISDVVKDVNTEEKVIKIKMMEGLL